MSTLFRYTKEWLSCMVVSGILLQDRTSSLYTMPQSHKEELKVHALFAPILTVMGKRTDLVKNCFRKEGPYGRFPTKLYNALCFILIISLF